jgi:dTDP-glucose 4,6-dehydratase
MRVLIAGGAGFIGSHLTGRLLGAGHRVTVLDNFITAHRESLAAVERATLGRALVVRTGDICRPPSLEGRFDAVLHLASPASPRDYLDHPLETLEAGSTGTRNLLELARRHGARFLLASTSEVYGDPEVHPQPESYWGRVNPIGPRSVYDEAKRFSESLASAYARRGLVVVRIARIFNTYGPGMRIHDGRVIPSLVSQAIQGLPLTIHGDGSQTRSYCYVDDLVRGLEALLWSEVEGPVNLGNPEEYTVLETAERIRETTGSKSPIIRHPLPEDDPRQRRPDITRARERLGWSPEISFADGLRRTVQDLSRRLTPARPRVASVKAARPQAPSLAPVAAMARLFRLPRG